MKNLVGKKIILFGGAGFIGHNLAIELKKRGAIPIIVDSLDVNNMGYLISNLDDNPINELYIKFVDERLRIIRENKIKIEVLDVRNYHAVCRVLDKHDPDALVHLAAVSHANRSNKDPYNTFDHSVRTLENALDACKNKHVHFVYFSSSMVYGDFGDGSAHEEMVCNPKGIYGALKYSGEKIIAAYNQVFGLEYTIIRPSALYGQRCVSRRVGQAFIENAMMGKDLTINGDGTSKLDFTYIQDLIEGTCCVLASPTARGEIFNITYGSARSVLDLAKIVSDNFSNIKIKHHSSDALMPERGTLNIEKAKSLLGYEPSYPIDSGFLEYIEWYKSIGQLNARMS